MDAKTIGVILSGFAVISGVVLFALRLMLKQAKDEIRHLAEKTEQQIVAATGSLGQEIAHLREAIDGLRASAYHRLDQLEKASASYETRISLLEAKEQ